MICNFSDLLIYNMNGTKELYKFFQKILLSYYFIKIINLAHSPSWNREKLLFNRDY